jgi:hypothetical protein
MTTGSPASRAARATPIASSAYVHRDRGDHVGRGVGEGRDLGGVVVLPLPRGELRGRVVAVVLGADAAADHDGRPGLVVAADLLHEGDRLAVQVVELLRRVADLGRPAGARPPGGALEHEADFVPAGERHVRRVVGAQRLRPLFVLEEVECREQGQVEAVVEDEGRLDAAIGQEQAAVELRQVMPMRHGSPFGRGGGR